MENWKAFFQPPRRGVHRNNSPCQDSIYIEENNDIIAVAVSDGVGSLKNSEVASQSVATAAARFLANGDIYQECGNSKSLIRKLVEVSRQSVISVCELQGLNKDDMDCTLLFAVLFKNNGIYLTGQLGDGAICKIKKDSAEKIPTFKDGVKSGSNMTKTIFSNDAESFFSVNLIDTDEELLGIVLTTDGLQNEIYSGIGEVKQNVQWYYNTIVSCDLEKSRALIGAQWNKIAEDSPSEFSDDMSLAVIYQTGKMTKLPQDPNWLCVCGHRNNLESSRCNRCMKDFLRIYKGAPYQDFGGKKQFFLHLNENPQEEFDVLNRLCTYDLPKEFYQMCAVDSIETPFNGEPTDPDKNIEEVTDPSETENKTENPTTDSKIDSEITSETDIEIKSQIDTETNLEIESEKSRSLGECAQNTVPGSCEAEERGRKWSDEQKLLFVRELIIALAFFILGFIAHWGIS